MSPMRFAWLSQSIVLCLSIASTTVASEPYVLASHELHPSATGWFNAGAGQGYDGGILYDNKKAQTFVPSESGFIGSVSIAVYRMSDTTAPLRIRITDTIGGVPNTTLSETYVASSEVPTSLSGRPYLNATGTFDSTTLFLEAGQQYAIVFDSAETEANYRIHGSYEYPYADGTRFKSQNTNVWTEQTLGDYFFQVLAKPRSEIRALSFPADNHIQLEWTNSLGQIWIDQSTNLVDWLPICGPLTNTNVWAGAIDIGDTGFFRIRQTE
jgi:hypothetical protein